MDNILDMLIEYAKNNKDVDKCFVATIVCNAKKNLDLGDYLSKVNFTCMDDVVTNHLDYKDPMAYSWYNRQIYFDFERVKTLSDYAKNLVKKNNCSSFEENLAGNSMTLHALLHEIEHANQLKKSNDNTNGLEENILKICYSVKNRFLSKDELERSFMIDDGLYLDTTLVKDLKSITELDAFYSTHSPFERMASIYSCRKVNNILCSANEDIPNVVNLFNKFNLMYPISGYECEEGLSAPTRDYLEDFESLEVYDSDKLFTDKFIKQFNDACTSYSLDDRLLLGLDITEEEHSKVKNFKKVN